jgi:hypothetical protein
MSVCSSCVDAQLVVELKVVGSTCAGVVRVGEVTSHVVSCVPPNHLARADVFEGEEPTTGTRDGARLEAELFLST